MAKRKIFRKWNYILVEKEDGTHIAEYSTAHSHFELNDDSFELEQDIGSGGRIIFSFADVDAGNVVNEFGSPYTQATLKQFLLANTAVYPVAFFYS